ncbi:hypothetical protein AALA82_00870 [Oscillospiraceae bacterium 50-16]
MSWEYTPFQVFVHCTPFLQIPQDGFCAVGGFADTFRQFAGTGKPLEFWGMK